MLAVSWALTWAAHCGVRHALRTANVVLLLASAIFYFWGEGKGILILLGSIAANYLLGLALERADGRAWRRSLLAVAIISNLSALGMFKYAAFGARCANGVFGLSLHVPAIALPLGISFYTFQAMSYVIDIYRGDIKAQRSLMDFACYISMFPQLVAGPIVRYSDIAEALKCRDIGLCAVASGMRRFLVGLARKVVIANVAADFADCAWKMVSAGQGLPAAYAWLALVCYTLQIYFDFSGYSDMAIGIGRMLGFEFPENFNYPYVSKSIREFWRRWHITLSNWFRDYLYIPLGGSRCSVARACLNGLIVFTLCGLWHGASVMFLLWGLWHGLFIITERLCPWRLGDSLGVALLGRIRTLATVMIGWILFRSESLSEARLFVKSLLGSAVVAPQTKTLAIEANPLLLSVVAIGALLASGAAACARKKMRAMFASRFPAALNATEWTVATVGALVALLLVSGGSYNPFIYFRF